MPAFFSSRTGRRVLSDAEEFRLLNDLPYGRWRCEDGRVVLFNRFYEPILESRPGEALKPADPTEWVPWVEQEWFYGDVDNEKQKRRKAEAALAEARSSVGIAKVES
jgi:hypothetical protein